MFSQIVKKRTLVVKTLPRKLHPIDSLSRRVTVRRYAFGRMSDLRVQEWAYIPAVEVYERETDEVVKLFLADRLSLTACIVALDSALEDLIPRLNPEDATRLRIVMLSNNEVVMTEMERRSHLETGKFQLSHSSNTLTYSLGSS